MLGVDAFRAAAINPALVAASGDRLDALRGDTLFPSAAAARWLDVKTGDIVVVESGLRDVALRVAGVSGAVGPLRYAVMDIAAAQDRFDRAGRLTHIDIRLAPGADRGVVERRLQALLPPGVDVAPPESSANATARLSRAYRVNLNVLALVALFTGSMLVFATQTLAVARRRPQFALLRTLGLTRAQLVRSVIGEAALLGAIGAAVGLVAGYWLAWFALRRFGPDLGAGFFRGREFALAIEPVSMLAFATLGIAAAIAGSLGPAREAAKAAPAAALKASDSDLSPAQPHSSAWGWALIAVGIAASFLPPIDDLPLFGYCAIASILIGGILVLPRLAQAALRAAPAPRNVCAALAFRYLRAAPGRVGATLAAMVTSVALMVSMAIMVASFRQSLDDWLGVMLPADLYVRGGIRKRLFRRRGSSRHCGDRRDRPCRIHARARRSCSIAARPRVALLARDIDPQNAGSRLALVRTSAESSPTAPPPAWISEAAADMAAVAPGETLALPIAGRTVAFTVAGIWRDYVRQQGAIVIERSRYVALTGDDTVNEAALWLAPGASPANVRALLAKQLGGATRVLTATPRDLRKLSLAAFDRTFAVTYALEAAAVVIGLVGLSAALVAQTLARSREFGMLRHVGMTRRQLASMLAFEGAVLAGIGVTSGLALGFAISLILVEVVNRQSFHWGMDLHVPWLALVALSTVLLALATLTAAASARGATSISAVRAVREDW